MTLADIFEEWCTYAERKLLFPRDFDGDAMIRTSASKIVAVTGVRRSGKSSFLMLLYQRLKRDGHTVGYVNVEDSRIKDHPETLDEVLKWFGDTGFIILDEITSAHDWQGWLVRSHELHKGQLHIIVSSSQKSLLVPNKPLRGRILSFEMLPLSFREYLAFRGVKPKKTTASRGEVERRFLDYAMYGGFPEVALTDDRTDRVRILNSYFRDIVGLDIAEAAHEVPGTAELFGKYALQSPYFSASKCLNFFTSLGYRVGKERLLHLEQYAEAGCLFSFLPIFSLSIRDRSQYPRKAYCIDPGFYYAMTGKTDWGRLYENIALLELRRRAQGLQEICYWKNRQGFEIDFVVLEGTSIVEAIQVVYDLHDEDTEKREIRALLACKKDLQPPVTYVLTRDVSETKTYDGIDVTFIPLMDWLLQS
ncbi:MAG: ATP-binding protein [Methanoregula sp.]